MIIGISRVQLAIGNQILVPDLLPRAVDLRRHKMRVARRAAQSRKMLAAARRLHAPQARRETPAHTPTTSAAFAAGGRVPSTSADSGSARSTTGASVVLNPNAFTARAISSPCSRASRRLAQLAHCRANGLRRGQRRQRIAQPVHRSAFHIDAAHRMRRAQKPVASSSSARVCVASAMLRLKRMTPPGRTSLSHARSRPVSSVPPSPTTSRLPAAWRKRLHRSFVPQLLVPVSFNSCCNSSSRFSACSGVSAFTSDGFDAIDNALRERRKDRQLHRLRRSLHLHALPLLLFVLPQHMLARARSPPPAVRPAAPLQCRSSCSPRRAQCCAETQFRPPPLSRPRADCARAAASPPASSARDSAWQTACARRSPHADTQPSPTPARARRRSPCRGPSRPAESASAASPCSESSPSPSSPP